MRFEFSLCFQLGEEDETDATFTSLAEENGRQGKGL